MSRGKIVRWGFASAVVAACGAIMEGSKVSGAREILQGPLELVARLAAESEHDRATLERILGTPLQVVEAPGDPYYDVYRGTPEAPAWLSRVELRRARSGTASLLVLTILPPPCLSPKSVLEQFGEPDDRAPSNPGRPRSTMTYRYMRGDDDLAFAFHPTATTSCLVDVVLDRIRNRCVEVRTIHRNTQAHFGEHVGLGVGNIWEGEYETESGATEWGLSAGTTVVVDGRPEETLRLRIGPGSQFQAGGKAFRVEGVRPDGVTLCRLTPPSLSPRNEEGDG